MVQVKLSISNPCKNGITAPPTIAVDNIPEARVVCVPKPLTDKENIIANITELKRPIAIMLQTATRPLVLTETSISITAIAAHIASTNPGFTVFKIKVPKSRPITILPQ